MWEPQNSQNQEQQTLPGTWISKHIAMGILLSMAIVALMAFLPLAAGLIMFLLPLPVLYYRLKLSRKHGAAIPVICGVILAAISGGFTFDVLMILEFMLLGFLLAECMHQNLSIEKSIGYASSLVLITGGASLWLYSLFMGLDMVELMTAHVHQNVTLFFEMAKQMGATDSDLQNLAAKRDQVEHVVVAIIPGIVSAFTLMVAWGTLLLARPILVSRRVPFPNYGPLNRWRVPEHLVWGVIGCVFVLLLLKNQTIALFCINILLILMMIYFIGGLAIVSFFFEKLNIPVIFRLLLYWFLIQGAMFIVVGLGFFDTWANFRKWGSQTDN